MHIRKLSSLIRKAILFALVFVMASNPILVAASPAERDPHAEAIDLILQGGETYLDSAARATFESAELFKILSAIQAVPLQQLSESYIADTIDRTLSIAEDASIALGAADDLADGIEQISSELPAAIDIEQAASEGLPDQLRNDLITHAGLTPSQAHQLSASVLDLYSARQSAAAGLPAGLQADLLSFGFTQSQIDEIATAVGQRGLVNPGLETRLAQFRAAQDELADVRAGMLVLAVQLLGYQIAVRQYNGIQPRAVTDAELEELAQDELRLLIHAAHLEAAWGDDPGAEVGEGDWWFIEHYAARMADRLGPLIVETQNRGLVAELFVAHQMRMLAVSARSGDAAYAKAELDNLAALLAYRLEASDYYQQRSSANPLEKTLAKIAALPALREHVTWPVSGGALKNAKLATQRRIQAFGVQNLAVIIGSFDESDETNNQASILIVAGMESVHQFVINVAQLNQNIEDAFTNGSVWLWIEAILTGNTDNPALLTANVILSFIPVLSVIIDLISLIVDPSIGIKAISLIGIIAGLGDIAALFPGTVAAAILIKVADIGAAVTKGLFRISKFAFRTVIDTLKFADAFDIMIKFLRTTGEILFEQGIRQGDNILEAVNRLFSGGANLWGNFVAYVSKVADEGLSLVDLGFDHGGVLAGRIINEGVDLSGDAIKAIIRSKIADDLLEAGIELSDEAAEGLGKLAKTLDGDEFQRFMKSVDLDQVEDVSKAFKNFDSLTREGAEKIASNVGGENFGKLMSKYADDPDAAERIFKVLGNAIDEKSLKIAMNQGEEAVHALSRWDKKFLGNPNITEELAKRAGKDALAFQMLEDLIAKGGNDTVLINKIADLYTQNNSSFYVLGRWENGLEGGYAKIARELDANYFYPHEKMLDTLSGLGPQKQQAVADAINASAIRAGADNGAIFKYTLEDAIPVDKGVIEQLWKKGKELRESGASNEIIEEAFDGIIKPKYEDGIIPGRMKELKILFLSGYEKITFDSATNLFTLLH